MKILLFAGSLRTESLNKKLIKVAKTIVASFPDCECESVDLRSLDIPVYDGDIESRGIPDGVKKLGEMIAQADAVITASPEYNWSISGPFKNAIDWVSRLRPVPFDKKPIFLMGASPGGFGAIRGLTATRAPLEANGAYLFPAIFALPKAGQAFSATGELTDPETETKLRGSITQFISFTQRFL